MPEKPNEITDVVSDLEPVYQSKAEQQIGQFLDQYGIPFFYRQPTVVYHNGQNELWKPVFTLPQSGGMVIDYTTGTATDHDKAIETLIQAYRYNQIPAVVLGPKDLDRADWEKDLYNRIQQGIRPIADYQEIMLP